MKCCINNYIVRLLLILNVLLEINAKHTYINKDNENVITKLLHIIKYNVLDEYASTDNELEELDNSNFKNANPATEYAIPEAKRGYNTRLVKRLVPHDYKSEVYEYDEKFKTLYRPLVRIHSNGHNRLFVDDVPIKDSEIENIRGVPHHEFDEKDEYSLEPFKLNKAEITPERILEDLKEYLRSEQDVKKVRALKYALLGVLENRSNVLRSVLYIPPGQVNSRPDKDDLLVPDPAAQWGSSYSYWDYWTYNKPVHEDHCKGRLIQWGNMCIETPPH